jgi:hypothetical protein
VKVNGSIPPAVVGIERSIHLVIVKPSTLGMGKKEIVCSVFTVLGRISDLGRVILVNIHKRRKAEINNFSPLPTPWKFRIRNLSVCWHLTICVLFSSLLAL